MEKIPTLIIFSGLPGSGKTTIARELSKQINATFFRVDSTENAMKRSMLKIHPAEDAGYMVGYAIALDNLTNGMSVVADSVNPIKLTRDDWKAVAAQSNAHCLEVEVICSDLGIHKKRVESRLADLPVQKLPSWEDVTKRSYEDWDREHLIIDSAKMSVDECVAEIITNF
ncbi:MAG: AAA family ATPase [Cohaesibacteraceae bacterium]|nr:AAA family ATPase [Cohaesibacteraceae bacterium]MBL4783841.1 AAA family ATPase [Cohaesibacteraceae bacterium]